MSKEMPQHFKLAQDNKDHFLIHDSRDNTHFKVSKKELHPATQIKVMKMQKLADGDKIPHLDQGTKPSSDSSTGDNTGGIDPVSEGDFKHRMDQIASIPSMVRGLWHDNSNDASPAQPVDQAPQSVAPTPQSVAPTPQSVAPTPAPVSAGPAIPYNPLSNVSMAGYPTVQSVAGMQGQEQKGIQEEAQAKAAQNNAMLPIMQQHQDAEDQRTALYNANMAKYAQQQDDLMKNVMAQKIDPDAYWKDHSKVTAGISVLLSGIGAGLQHSTTNLALQTIDNGINKNIEAQKAELGKKENLLSENLRQQGNLRAAEDTTRAQSLAAFQGKLQLEAAKTGNPVIMAQAKQAAANIGLKYAPLLQSTAQNQTQMQIRQNVMKKIQSGAEPNAVDLVQANFIPKELQENAYKEQASIDANKKAHASVDALFDKLEKEQTTSNLANPQSYARVKDIGAELTNTVMNSSASKRLTEETAKREIDPLLTHTMETKQSRDMNRQTVHNIIDNHADPTPIMNNLGLGIKSTQSAPTKTVNGITYKRGANGEAIRVN